MIEDYTRNNEKIPEAIKKVSKPKFKLRKFAKVSNDNTSELIEVNLYTFMMKGIGLSDFLIEASIE